VSLVLENISLSIKEHPLLCNLSLTIAPGEIVTLMGASGTGKSSLLSYIAGDLPPAITSEGDIKLNDQSLNEVRPELRQIGRLFQDDLLFPHMTVGENLLFAIPRGAKNDRMEMMFTALHRAELDGFADRAPDTLSGGQKSRVSLMRALLAKPKAMLLDEPFNKLDTALRSTIRDYSFAHLKTRQVPTLLVTHDRADAPPHSRIFEISRTGEIKHV
jgi:putative thiamine transport system ATP-binding protein